MTEYEDIDAVPVAGTPENNFRQPANGTVIVAVIVYALHSLTILAGALSAGAAIVLGFVFSAPAILAVILNYIFRSDAAGTFLASHFRWQIRTFWLAAGWLLLISVAGALLAFFGIGFVLLWVGIPILGIWVSYRIILGWVRLFRNQPMPD